MHGCTWCGTRTRHTCTHSAAQGQGTCTCTHYAYVHVQAGMFWDRVDKRKQAKLEKSTRAQLVELRDFLRRTKTKRPPQVGGAGWVLLQPRATCTCCGVSACPPGGLPPCLFEGKEKKGGVGKEAWGAFLLFSLVQQPPCTRQAPGAHSIIKGDQPHAPHPHSRVRAYMPARAHTPHERTPVQRRTRAPASRRPSTCARAAAGSHALARSSSSRRCWSHGRRRSTCGPPPRHSSRRWHPGSSSSLWCEGVGEVGGLTQGAWAGEALQQVWRRGWRSSRGAGGSA